jgi:DNA-binding IclR family transcriptional regulator
VLVSLPIFHKRCEESDLTDSSVRVASVTRALRLVELIAVGPADGLPLTELARAINLSKSSTLALLRTLADAGFIRIKEPGPRYLPGLALVRLGDLSGANQPIDEIAQGFIHRLAQETGMTIRVAINDGGCPVFVSRADAPGSIRFHTMLGVRELPHVSSAGKAILAQLEDEEIIKVIAENGLVARTKRTRTTMAALMRDIRQIREKNMRLMMKKTSREFSALVPHFSITWEIVRVR